MSIKSRTLGLAAALGCALSVSTWQVVYGQKDTAGVLLQKQSVQQRAYVQQKSTGLVTLEVTPSWNGSALVVEFTASTHSVDLSKVDLRAQTQLIVNGKKIQPDSSSGGLTGHHAKLVLEFRLAAPPERFSLEIRNVPDIAVRVLDWPPTKQTKGGS